MLGQRHTWTRPKAAEQRTRPAMRVLAEGRIAVKPSPAGRLSVLPPTACLPALRPSRTHWSLVMDQSTFVDWQKAKVQENPDEVGGGRLGPGWEPHGGRKSGGCKPAGAASKSASQSRPRAVRQPTAHLAPAVTPQVPAGSLPRTMEVILRNDQVGLRPRMQRRPTAGPHLPLLPLGLHSARQPLHGSRRPLCVLGGRPSARVHTAPAPPRPHTLTGGDCAAWRQGGVHWHAGRGARRGSTHVSGPALLGPHLLHPNNTGMVGMWNHGDHPQPLSSALSSPPCPSLPLAAPPVSACRPSWPPATRRG